MNYWSSSSLKVEAVLDQWRSEVAIPAMKSSRFMLAICAAFAAPLCAMLKRRPYLIHLYGPPARDRLCVIEVAAGIFGDRGDMQSWLSLSAAPKVVATNAAHDGLLVLNESGRLTDAQLANVTAALWADGADQSKVNTRTDAIALSACDALIEQPSARIVSGEGKVWILNVPASAWCGHGVFESAADSTKAEWFSARTMVTNGQVGGMWLRYLNYCAHKLLPPLRVEPDFSQTDSVDLFSQLHMNECIACFDLLAAAGELASEQGLTGWPAGAATEAVAVCRRAFERVNHDRLQVMTGRFLE
jgi:putative DNA primase/helicase